MKLFHPEDSPYFENRDPSRIHFFNYYTVVNSLLLYGANMHLQYSGLVAFYIIVE